MSELDPRTPELQATPDPPDVAANLDEPVKSKGGRPKKIDWYARREEIWNKMNAAIDGGSPAPAVIRALQSQLDTCNQQIAQDHDEQIKARARRELTRHAESIFEVFDNTFPEFPGSEFDTR